MNVVTTATNARINCALLAMTSAGMSVFMVQFLLIGVSTLASRKVCLTR
jgi:hypothetical protein